MCVCVLVSLLPVSLCICQSVCHVFVLLMCVSFFFSLSVSSLSASVLPVSLLSGSLSFFLCLIFSLLSISLFLSLLSLSLSLFLSLPPSLLLSLLSISLCLSLTLYLSALSLPLSISLLSLPLPSYCSAGAGRTGIFICIDNILEQIKKEQLVDIAGTITKMRHERMKMVQTPVSR